MPQRRSVVVAGSPLLAGSLESVSKAEGKRRRAAERAVVVRSSLEAGGWKSLPDDLVVVDVEAAIAHTSPRGHPSPKGRTFPVEVS